MSMKASFNDSKHEHQRNWMKRWYNNLTPEKKEQIRLKSLKYRQTNRDKINKQKHEYYITHIDFLRKRNVAWRKKHTEYIKRHKHEYYLKWRERTLAYYRLHSKDLSKRRKENILKELNQFKCQNCGFDKWLCSLDIHHINGNNSLTRKKRINHLSRNNVLNHIKENKDNLMVLCKNCHQAYHSKLIELPKNTQNSL